MEDRPSAAVALLRHAVTVDFTYKKILGNGAGEFARVVIQFEPADANSFISSAPGAAVPLGCLAGVETGVLLGAKEGTFAGCALHGYRATLVDGAYHDMDSNPHAFEMAARGAMEKLALTDAIEWPSDDDPRFPPAAAMRQVATDDQGT